MVINIALLGDKPLLTALDPRRLRRGLFPAVMNGNEPLECVYQAVHTIIDPPQIWRYYRAKDGQQVCVSFEDDYLDNTVSVRLVKWEVAERYLP